MEKAEAGKLAREKAVCMSIQIAFFFTKRLPAIYDDYPPSLYSYVVLEKAEAAERKTVYMGTLECRGRILLLLWFYSRGPHIQE